MPLSASLDTDDSITTSSGNHMQDKDMSDSSDIDSDPDLENWIQQATTTHA